MKRFGVIFSISALLAGQVFAADWYAKETRWAGHDPDIIRYEDGYALATTDNHICSILRRNWICARMR